jgi:hypothetical protein
LQVWPGARRAGLGKAEPGAGAGPAAAHTAAALIQIRLNSAMERMHSRMHSAAVGAAALYRCGRGVVVVVEALASWP